MIVRALGNVAVGSWVAVVASSNEADATYRSRLCHTAQFCQAYAVELVTRSHDTGLPPWRQSGRAVCRH